jgi:RNA polymerase sigma-70 factor (ECF subfamily)
MPVHAQADLASALLAEIPRMRAYARLMTNDRFGADLEVEEAIKCVLADDIRWSGGVQVRVELIKILRGFLARDRRPPLLQGVRDECGTFCCLFAALGRTNTRGRTVSDVAPALLHLSFEAREAMVLSEAAGFTDLEIAKICGCAPEIVRERVQNGRARLAELLGVEFGGDLNPVTAPAAAVEPGDENVMSAA